MMVQIVQLNTIGASTTNRNGKIKIRTREIENWRRRKKGKIAVGTRTIEIEQKERQDRLAMEERIKTKEKEAKLRIEEKQGSSNSSTQSGFDATKNIR